MMKAASSKEIGQACGESHPLKSRGGIFTGSSVDVIEGFFWGTCIRCSSDSIEPSRELLWIVFTLRPLRPLHIPSSTSFSNC
eukprot:scaffold137954_cov31-Tisochrysis_lutea.AAC.6